MERVLGHTQVVNSLKKVIKDGRAHCFLFSGPAGTGKTTLARILASEFAGRERTVVNIEEFDAASKSGAEDIRELVTRTLYRAIGASPVKFIIIDEAHRLSAAAWTVLLKPMEEPPAHVYYALCTTDPAKIPKANLTRCLRYDLKPVKEDLIQDLLLEVIEAESLQMQEDLLVDLIPEIAENCGGSPRQALVWLESCLGCSSLSEAREIMRSTGESKEIVDLARFLVRGQGLSWANAQRLLKSLGSVEAESCRIVLMNYFAAVLANTTKDSTAKHILGLIEAFKTPYYSADKMAPLYYSVAIAIGMDE